MLCFVATGLFFLCFLNPSASQDAQKPVENEISSFKRSRILADDVTNGNFSLARKGRVLPLSRVRRSEDQRYLSEDGEPPLGARMRTLLGEQTIRHGKSRNYYSRMNREKKMNELNSLRYVSQELFGDDPFSEDLGTEPKLPAAIAPGQKLEENSSALPPEPKEDKYDLRSFFGYTSGPEGDDTLPEDNKILDLPILRHGQSAQQHVGIFGNKTNPSHSAEMPVNLVSPTFSTSFEEKRDEGLIKKDKFGNNIYTENNAPERTKSSLENVHSFINFKNRSKKKDDMKHEVDVAPTGVDIQEDDVDKVEYPDEELSTDIVDDGIIKIQGHADIVTRFLRIVESQHLLGENCTAGTDLNLGEGVVDRYAQERFRVEADVAVNRANMLTRLWKYAAREVMHSEYLLHAALFSMVEFDDDIFAAGNCYDQYQYKDYQLFCPFAYRLPEGPILVKDLAVEYKYLSNTSEWFYIARKNAENVIKNYNQFNRGFNTYTFNESAHTERVADEILSVAYDDGKWSKPYYDCGGGNIWMLTYTVPFFGFANDSYFFKGTSGIDIDLRRVDIDQCPLQAGSTQLNIFAATDKCKKRTTDCVPLPGLGFRRGSYKCVCRRGFYFPVVLAEHRFYNGTVIEEEYEKLMMSELSTYGAGGVFECLPCAEGCEACEDSSPCVVSLNWLVRSIILALSCIVICCLPIVVIFTWKYGNVKVVRAASPVLLRVIALGALFIYCTNIVMYPRPSVYSCTARVWLRELGFCLTYGALMLKTWRISVIFRVRSAKAVKITDFNLLKRLGIIVAVFSVFLVIRTLVAPPVVIVGRTATDLKAYLCKTDWWDHSFTMLEVMFLIWGIRLCIVVRKAPSEFNESRFISMAIYNEFLLSVFLNISMLFLQSPANPDLMYIIFFCHTQLTVTLLLCLIFGSKAYMVFRGHGKGDHEGSSMVSKTPAGKFMAKPRSGGNSQYATSTNSSANLNEYTKVTEQDIQEEFRRLYTQLESLKDKNMRFGNRHLTAKISAMQEAAVRQDSLGGTLREEIEPSNDKKKGKGGMFSAMADKLACSVITPGDESTSSGREYALEACDSSITTTKNKKLNVTFSPMKDCDCNDDNVKSEKDNLNSKSTLSSEDNSINVKSPKTRLKNQSSSPTKNNSNIKNSSEDSSSGCDKCLSKLSSIDAKDDESKTATNEKPAEKSEVSDSETTSTIPKNGSPPNIDNTSPNNTTGKSSRTPIKSGHARTHAIVINLDDKSRFTEEVTV